MAGSDAAQDGTGRAAGASPQALPALVIPPGVSDADVAALTRAVATLEGSSLVNQLRAVLGRQVELATQFVPQPVLEAVNTATLKALRVALRAAVRSLGKGEAASAARPRLHLAAAALAGAAGGTFGLSALPLELPLATTIMLRAIAAIAREEGEDLDDPATLLACLEVFALGSGEGGGPAGESSYLAMRAVLAKSVLEAARLVVGRGLVDEASPALVRLLAQIAQRFGVAVGQKAMTQALPVIGAVTGAAVNAAFTNHFQGVARAHFTIRRLERRYGEATVRMLYDALRAHGASPDDPPVRRALLPAAETGSAPG